MKTGRDFFQKLDKKEIFGINGRPYSSNILIVVKNIETFAAPLFYAKDESSTTVADFLTNGLPAISVKKIDGFTSVFHASKILSSKIVREIARCSGFHIYSESEDVLYANNNYMCIHASSKGEKVLHFKKPCSPYEVYEDQYYGQNVETIRFSMDIGQTKMFRV